jgi:hypothetical protein
MQSLGRRRLADGFAVRGIVQERLRGTRATIQPAPSAVRGLAANP